MVRDFSCFRHSSACFDSAPNWSVDFDDYLIMPERPIKVSSRSHRFFSYLVRPYWTLKGPSQRGDDNAFVGGANVYDKARKEFHRVTP